jgi:uncharacterized protein (TIGR00255 family)
MSISSMTGFARIEGEADGCHWTWEVRAVNGRGLDVRFRMPSFLSPLEDGFRKTARAKFSRGNLQVNLQLEKVGGAERELTVNADLVRKLAGQIKPLVDDGTVTAPSMDGLLAVQGVVEIQSVQLSLEDIKQPLQVGFDALILGLLEARSAEGAVTRKTLEAVLHRIEQLIETARSNPELQPDAILARLQTQIAALGETIAPERLAQEAALLAIKADVNEELERLSGHVEAARTLLKLSEPIGRKLEFLSQEFNREANTLCAKSGNQQLTDVGLELKTLIDQIREQAANVE